MRWMSGGWGGLVWMGGGCVQVRVNSMDGDEGLWSGGLNINQVD